MLQGDILKVSLTSGVELFHNKSWMLGCIYSENGFHNWDVPYFMTQWDSQMPVLELLLGHFWMIHTACNEINIKVVKWIYFG